MLKQRIITALALIFVFGAVATLLPPFWFVLPVAAVTLAAGWEWSRLAGLGAMAGRLAYLSLLVLAGGLLLAWLGVGPSASAPDQFRTMLVLGLGLLFWVLACSVLRGYPANRARWDSGFCAGAMGMLALLPSLAGVVYLKYLLPAGYLVLALAALTAAVDIGAYFVGRGFGRRQLAPELSPKKSWEGVWGGLAACLAAAAAMAWIMHHRLRPLDAADIALLAVLVLAVTLSCVIGDLLESMLKRNRHAKDSGNLLPGHGGLLDRIDGLLAATPVFALGMMALLQGNAEQ